MSRPGRGTGRLQSIGPYTLLDRVGSGGMGVVYRALDRRSGTLVAFKLLHEHISADPAAIERFRREAHVASLLRSSYAVHALDFGNEDGQYYFVSEFVEGRPLSEVLGEGRPDPLAAIAIVSQVALALDEAESRQITHRDIKPDNILLAEDGGVKLADFGIASLQYFGGLTVAGSYIGTVAYSAPEQHQGDADIRSDIYSLGVVLFEMLTGRKPFQAPTTAALMALHAESSPPLEALWGLTEGVVDVVRRALEKNPADRFQHVSEMLAALDGARSSLNSESNDAGALEAFIASTAATPAQPAGNDDETSAFPQPVERSDIAAEPAVESRPEPVASTVAQVAPAVAIGNSDAAGGRSRRLLFGGLVALILVAVVGGYVALAGAGDDARGNTPGASLSSPTPDVATPSTARALASATIAPTGTAAATSSPTQAPVVQPQPTATPVPPTATPVPPTATPTPSYSSPVFAPVLTANGLAPAGAVPSGGALGSCPVRELWAYVTHADVAVGTQLTGSWAYQGAFQANNPTFATELANGTTNYSFTNAQGLPSGTYTFTLRAGLAQVSTGTVTIVC
ncbi:MAG: protein kinase [Dehalococcoidia bacterium]